MSTTSTAMWQPSVVATYENGTTSYIDQLSGPMRLKYPNEMAEKELVTWLTEVLLQKFLMWKVKCFFLQGDKLYNAYERDIAIVNIFFGESTVFGELSIRSKNQNFAKLILPPWLLVVSYMISRV